MSLFVPWINLIVEQNGKKVVKSCTEKKDGRRQITDDLKNVILSH